MSEDPTGFGYRPVPSALGPRELHGAADEDPTGFGYRPILDGAAASLPFDPARTGPEAMRRLDISPPAERAHALSAERHSR